MALADVCGFSTGEAFPSLGFQTHDFQRDMMNNCTNLENGMVLAAPPFEDVSSRVI